MVSSSDDEDFVTYGTALEPLDEDTIPKKKPITVEEQFAKDEHGRRRFHGAFTGGFSAGFCNTVGSLEGWQPATFKSSRGSRAESKDQSVFDFMDAEDKSEHGICPMSLKVKPTFNDKTSESSIRKRAREISSEGPIPGVPVAQQLFVPVRDTMGVKLLMKMGWRPGQGVGPRVTKKEKKQMKTERDKMKIYGCSLPSEMQRADSDSSSETEFDINLDDLTFAPDDYQPYVVQPKQNTFGLGYKGLDKGSLFPSDRSSLSRLTVNGKTIRGQAFGVSVFEDDDDDIYGVDDMTKYDFTLGPEQTSNKKVVSSEGCIEGFHISLKPTQIREKFPLPAVPADFVPLKSRKFRWDARETPAPKTKILSAKERSKIIDDDVSTVAKVDPKTEEQELVLVEDTGIVQDTGYMFKPFANDQDKQSRYEKFLIFRKLNAKDRLASIQPTTMTAWQKERERTEFEQAARLYRPLSNDMADRFTSGGVQEDVHDILNPVAKTVNLELETRQEAARKKLFGVLTRRKYSWTPDRVLCKRFNIPVPAESSLQKAAENTQSKTHKTASIFEFLKSEAKINRPRFDEEMEEISRPSTSSEAQPVEVPETEKEPPLESSNDPEDTAENCMQTENDEEPAEEVLDISEKVDLFKAIFLSSSEDENEDEDAKNSNEPYSSTQLSRRNENQSNVKINYSPPRGIFANLDLESMRTKPSVSTHIQPPEVPKEKPIKISSPKEKSYGPALPSAFTPVRTPVQKDSLPWINMHNKKDKGGEEWVEKSHKHKKHKKKHKKNKGKDK